MPEVTELPTPTRRPSRQAAIEPIAVAPKVAGQMIGLGVTRIYELINAGELRSYLDGGARRILVASIWSYIERKLEADSTPVKRGPGRPRKTPTTA